MGSLRYNHGMDGVSGKGIVFIPVKGEGRFPFGVVNWNRITVASNTSCWYIWLHASRVDVYAFGIVLYGLISAEEAIVKSTESTDATSLVYLQARPQGKALQELTDPRLGGDYPIESVLKIAHLAKSCTHEEPRMRPTMRSVIVALMALLSN
ncbi:hypothetical protein HU200_038082 [Digitaria exilis]|uniref:Uncharacterized protein n=1 Tax=Digitaria exilis TaxID=1010633 RepID=A0A835EJ14_9POAL|nr:hypothetical protein HU200_038082 [Digitaria exilis]